MSNTEAVLQVASKAVVPNLKYFGLKCWYDGSDAVSINDSFLKGHPTIEVLSLDGASPFKLDGGDLPNVRALQVSDDRLSTLVVTNFFSSLERKRRLLFLSVISGYSTASLAATSLRACLSDNLTCLEYTIVTDFYFGRHWDIWSTLIFKEAPNLLEIALRFYKATSASRLNDKVLVSDQELFCFPILKCASAKLHVVYSALCKSSTSCAI